MDRANRTHSSAKGPRLAMGTALIVNTGFSWIKKVELKFERSSNFQSGTTPLYLYPPPIFTSNARGKFRKLAFSAGIFIQLPYPQYSILTAIFEYCSNLFLLLI